MSAGIITVMGNPFPADQIGAVDLINIEGQPSIVITFLDGVKRACDPATSNWYRLVGETAKP